MTKRNALHLVFTILGGLLIFHLLIISQLIPYDQVWGGRLQSEGEMIRFESFSILFNLFILLIFGIKYRLHNQGKNHKLINILIWIFAFFFILNTLGNFIAESNLEMILGSIFTLAMAVLSAIIARK